MQIGEIISQVHFFVPLILMSLFSIGVYLCVLSVEYQRLRIVKETFELLQKRLKELDSVEEKEKVAATIVEVKAALNETRILMKELRLLQ